MPKLHTDTVTAVDIVDYLKTGDDFPLEMRVLRACIHAEFAATHGGTYKDPATGKDRQFDIRATLTKGKCTIKLAIECKNLKSNFPLLVSRVPRRSDETYHGVIISRYLPGLPPEGSAYTKYRFEEESPYGTVPKIGKATIQIGRSEKREWVNGDAEVYEKWAQAVSSSVELVRLSLRDHMLIRVEEAATVVIPVLIVADGSLFAADYSAEGNMLGVHSVEECYLYLGKSVVFDGLTFEYRISHLGIFTETKFSEYLNRLSTEDKYWDLLFPNSTTL